MVKEVADICSIQHVANGWIFTPGRHPAESEYVHVYTTAEALAEHVKKWAITQTTSVEVLIKERQKQ